MAQTGDGKAPMSLPEELVFSVYKAFHLLAIISKYSITKYSEERRSALLDELKQARAEIKMYSEKITQQFSDSYLVLKDTSMVSADKIEERDRLKKEVEEERKKTFKLLQHMRELHAVVTVAATPSHR
eukprot:CAMPEP_0167762448 /NCGR_PEP_ID=MMETSP0110_2-20121227/12772_1 /TAXON_ID=629695 /ORGANISM="Gymnochlora sp., Strain CCMP2014" /LENGTH=127 /DNA_ID=CAMNT_0007649321 /DNA_START=34 /DNA_END=417 /DNA_ORIENTATION=+